MRLIDADALTEEIQENMKNGFPANENLSLYAISCIAHAPTVCDIEQIRAEIEQNKNRDIGGNCEQWVNGYRIGMNEALAIIDIYTK